MKKGGLSMQIRNNFFGRYLKVDFFVDNKIENADLYALAFGTARCNKQITSIKPAKFPFYSLHYVHRGQGVLMQEGEYFPMHAGDLFLIYPDTLVQHSRDEEDPWEIFWINFQGKLAQTMVERMNFRSECPRLSGNNEEVYEAFSRVLSGEIPSATKDLIANSLLYELFGIICKIHGNKTDKDTESFPTYVSDAIYYIEQNFANPELSIREVAAFCKINPSYLSRLFRAHLNLCFTHYLASLRMQKAKEFLSLKKYKVNEVSALVGYENPLYFSKEFKKYIGMPPSDYSGNYTKSLGKITYADE